MRQKHPPAAVPGEPDFVQQFAHVLLLVHVHDLILELLPFMCDHFATAEATYWDDHFTNISSYYYILLLPIYAFIFNHSLPRHFTVLLSIPVLALFNSDSYLLNR